MPNHTFRFIIFDLDDTLYPRADGPLKEVGRRIQRWLHDHLGISPERAAAIQHDYFLRYGTTLGGLLDEGVIGVAEAHDYLTYVHDVPVEEYLAPNPALAALLAAIPLRKAVYTNGTAEYARRVIRALGVGEYFERLIGIEDVALRNKLHRESYERALRLLGVEGRECIMVEDSAPNLRAARELGLTTIWLRGPRAPHGPATAAPEPGVDFVIECIYDVARVVNDIVTKETPL